MNFFSRLVISSALLIFCVSSAQAATVSASASYSLPGPPSGSSFDNSEFDGPTSGPGAIATANVNINTTYPVIPSTVAAHASAMASANDLKAGVTLDLMNFDTSIVGEGFFVDASARLSDTYTLAGATGLFGSPVFNLTGTLSSSNEFVSRVRLFSSQLGGTLFVQEGTSTSAIIDEIIVPDATSLSFPTFLSLSLSTAIERSTAPLVAGANYSSVADFSGTLTLLGFALFADEAKTIPVLDGVSVTGADGNSIPVISVAGINPIPLPAAFWLFGTAFIALIGYTRGRRKYFRHKAGA